MTKTISNLKKVLIYKMLIGQSDESWPQQEAVTTCMTVKRSEQLGGGRFSNNW